MANYQKAAKVGLASLLTFSKSLPKDSFNFNFGINLDDYSGLNGLISKLEAQTSAIGKFILLPREKTKPIDHLYQLLMSQASSNLKQAVRYKGILIETELTDLKRLKYVIPIILNRSSQVAFLVKRGPSKNLALEISLLELEIRRIVVELMQVSNSVGNSLELQVTYAEGDYFLISFFSTNSKKDCLLNYAGCGFLMASKNRNHFKIIPNFLNGQERKEAVLKETSMINMELQSPTLDQLFEEKNSNLSQIQIWGGSLGKLDHLKAVQSELEAETPHEDWSFLSKCIEFFDFLNSNEFLVSQGDEKKHPFYSESRGITNSSQEERTRHSLLDPDVLKILRSKKTAN